MKKNDYRFHLMMHRVCTGRHLLIALDPSSPRQYRSAKIAHFYGDFYRVLATTN